MRSKAGPKDLPPAPGDLRLVQAFLNTAELEAGRDALATPRELGEWLARHGLLAPGTELEAADHARALALREAWRALLGGSEKPGVVETFDRAIAAATLRARPDGRGATRLEAANAGLDGSIGRLLVIATEARRDGAWSLLKVCASPTCRAVFYDFSTNHTGKWCRPRCGNRQSSRVSKRRQRRYSGDRNAARTQALGNDLPPLEIDQSKVEKLISEEAAKWGVDIDGVSPPAGDSKS